MFGINIGTCFDLTCKNLYENSDYGWSYRCKLLDDRCPSSVNHDGCPIPDTCEHKLFQQLLSNKDVTVQSYCKCKYIMRKKYI